MPEFHSIQMNTRVHTSGLNAPDASRIFEWMTETESRFSRFLVSSELYQVNQSPNLPVTVSPRFAELLFEALRFYSETGGIFNPFLGDVLQELGYDRSFEKMDRLHARRAPGIRPASSEKVAFEFDIEKRNVNLHSGCSLDFGGIAKGWAVQKSALALIHDGRSKGMINAGGDIMCWSDERCLKPWVIDIAHPFSDDKKIGRLNLRAGRFGVATSSTIKRSWSDGHHRFHHLIDPRTALPSESDIIQATALGTELLPCEIYAKCLLIMGSRCGPAWLEARRSDLAYVFIDKQGEVIASPNLNEICINEHLPDKLSFPLK
ncbi:FAD:protein FMN transferase [Sporolactobacillus shoreicorticis]|uniref:FAD:protein FMN transferase n=1 Tax=Sporolactobacillus shoreicorticis TaxID=1923877 RepID=A0ABW5S4R0_9BACL|nr:FAD:protein FMN transferase [Sporolactobacillus shoreicorticis]MCO7127189.1 FAD:protein FMN transferase [Sporolactobacillus shoreicorticis]